MDDEDTDSDNILTSSNIWAWGFTKQARALINAASIRRVLKGNAHQIILIFRDFGRAMY